MKKYCLILLPIALLPMLSACKDTEHSILAVNAYDKTMIQVKVDDVSEMIDSGMPFLLETFSPYCGHCEDLEPILQQYVDATSKTIYRLDLTELKSEDEFNVRLHDKYPDIFEDSYVPSMMFINQGKLTYDVPSAKFNSYTGLKSILDKHFIDTNISTITKKDSYSSYVNDHTTHLGFVFDYNDYSSMCYNSSVILSNQVSKSKKDVLIINKQELGDDFSQIQSVLGVSYSTFAYIEIDGVITKTIDYSLDDGSAIYNLVNEFIA